MSTSAATESLHQSLLIQEAIQAELERAKIDGISRETLPNAREGQLTGYIAGLQEALRIAGQA